LSTCAWATVILGFASLYTVVPAHAQSALPLPCPRPAASSVVNDPAELRSKNGVLNLELTYRNFKAVDGQQLYCYQSKDGSQAPTLRLQPGDLLILRLKNELTAISDAPAVSAMASMPVPSPCASAQMTALSTNLHFHGTTVPPACHADDALHTMIQPGDPPFEYRFRIPANEPPGLYWYHPHVHGFTNPQVLGGASGALIVEGIERANRKLAGLPERVFIIRDQELLHPDALPAKPDLAPPVIRDAEGDILNTGTGGGKPAKDLSINFVPVPYPDYPPAAIMVRPSERQLWRVLNASAVTYLDLQVLADNQPVSLGVVSLDGVPINENGMARDRVLWVDHVFLPPSSRAEWIFKGVPQGAHVRFITRSVDTGPAGENDPVRPLAEVVASRHAPASQSLLAASPAPLPPSDSVWLGNVQPARVRKLYFSERPSDPNRPDSPTMFMITVDGQTPAPYDPHASEPEITARQGDVEDWVIENRSRESHAFHIHQVHFMLIKWQGVPVDEPFLRDTIDVPYWDGKSTRYPSVTLRMDFRDPNAVGTFVYHCHLLEHEDGGMMGTIRLLPKAGAQDKPAQTMPAQQPNSDRNSPNQQAPRTTTPARRMRSPGSHRPRSRGRMDISARRLTTNPRCRDRSIETI
jgi:FtsP/CotA-like multicopper oxidase with cupredoxin domain